MNRCRISISRRLSIPLLSFKSETETKQESVVAMLPYEYPLYTEIVVLFSKNQHLSIASHQPLILPLSLKLSSDPATRSFLGDTLLLLKINC